MRLLGRAIVTSLAIVEGFGLGIFIYYLFESARTDGIANTLGEVPLLLLSAFLMALICSVIVAPVGLAIGLIADAPLNKMWATSPVKATFAILVPAAVIAILACLAGLRVPAI